MKHIKQYENNDDKPDHKIYYSDVNYIEKNKIIKLTGILNKLDIFDKHKIKYDIILDVDFKHYILYCYPNTHDDEYLLIKNEFTWYSWIGTISRFREIVVNTFDDVPVSKNDIQIILTAHKYNI